MSKRKQAKMLSEKQIKTVISYLESNSRNPERDKVIFLLSLHGLRCKEIGSLTLSMITDAESNLSSVISLQDIASKGKSGGDIPMSKNLTDALTIYLQVRGIDQGFVVRSERGERLSANALSRWFKRLYRAVGFEGASAHSGKRTFITNAARKISLVGGSLKDVMMLARHSNLSTTSLYIVEDEEAKRKVVDLIFKGV
jgi:integrase/recombinase XerD